MQMRVSQTFCLGIVNNPAIRESMDYFVPERHISNTDVSVVILSNHSRLGISAHYVVHDLYIQRWVRLLPLLSGRLGIFQRSS